MLAAPAAIGGEREPVALSGLPDDVLCDFARLFAWHHAPPALGIGAASGAASLFDEELQDYFVETERLGIAGDLASHPAVLAGAIGSLFAAGWFAEAERHREMSYDLGRGLLVANAVTFAVKLGVRRERPDGGTFSFPSGHAANTFTVAAVLDRHYGWRIGLPAYAFAAFVSLSRLDQNSHWLSDSVAGAGIGLLVGHVVAGRRALPSPSSRLHWAPVFVETGMGIRFHLDLGPR